MLLLKWGFYLFLLGKLSEGVLDAKMICIRPLGNASVLHDPQSLLDAMRIKLVNLLGKEVRWLSHQIPIVERRWWKRNFKD